MARGSKASGWRTTLVLLGIALLAAAVWMQIEVLTTSTMKTETTAGSVVTTKSDPPAPSATLVTGALGLGVACLLIASFFERIKKVTVGGVEIELDPASVGMIAALATQRAQGNLAQVGPLVTGALAAIRTGSVYPQVGAGASDAEVAEATLVSAVETTATQLGL